MSVMALSAIAEVYPDDIPSIVIPQAEQNAIDKANKAKLKNSYFVLLEDEPVALYQGGIKGFKATNVAASNGVNGNEEGKLNLKSSASVVYGDYLSLKQNQASSKINQVLGRNVELKSRYKVALNGLLVDLQPNEALALRKLPGVLAVQKNEMKQLLTDVGPQHVGAPAIWDNPDVEGSKGEGLVVGVMDTGIGSYLKKVYTYQGIAKFDTMDFHPSFADVGGDGYDHTNPYGEGVYFGDCVDEPFWCNDKLVGVVSFNGARFISGVRTNDYRFNKGQDDHGHGTHVASTIAGNVVHNVQYPTTYPSMTSVYKHKYYHSEIDVSISGVAPHANIVSYKTCNLYGCLDSLAIESIEHAIANNVDVLNYSVGGGATSPWFTADALAFLSAREAGIHTAVAVGNSGRNGAKTIGSPGNSPWVTSVAALSHSRDFTEEKVATFVGGNSDLGDLIGKGATSGVLTPTDIVYAGDIESDSYAESAGGIGYCSKYSIARADVEGKVVICRRGGVDSDGAPLTRLSKGDSALYAKAAGMIFINSEDEYDNVANDPHVLPTVHLNKADGEALLTWLAEGEGHQVSFTDSELVLNDDKADITADFTSRGPDYYTGDYLVPDVGAPGVDILAGGIGKDMHSTSRAPYEQVDTDWRFMSGTSMATPHIAGMYLLMKAARPTWTAAEAQSALMMTAFTDVKEDDDFDGEMNRADIHRTGSGSARVNLAIEAGLVLNETRAGYEAANPYAEEYGMTEMIPGWHGQPHQMNMPSLSKGECLIECVWSRTFKATKSASWTVSFEYYNEGFSLTSDQESFTLNEGEELALNFTAEALQGLEDEWVNGRVILTPSDESIPVQTLPVTVNFIAGIAPESVDVTVKRTNDSAPVAGIVTIGTDEMQLTKSGIAKAQVYDFELQRDATNGQIFHHDIEDNKTIKVFPLNVQADTNRLVVEVLETSSPDLDIFIGIDSNLDGKLSHVEMNLIRYMSATEIATEVVDLVSPIQDTYWVLVHNWAEGPETLAENEMVCAEGEEAEEGKVCAEAPIMDNVKLAISNVAYDDDSMTVSVPDMAAPRAEVPTRVEWDQVMEEGDIYHGVFWLGTSPELNQNIGAVRVNMTRGQDDVSVSEPIVNGDKITFAVRVAANKTGESRDYDFDMALGDGVIVDLVLLDKVVAGAKMQMASEGFSYKTTNQSLTWSHTQEDGADAIAFNIILDASMVEGLIDATPVVDASVSSSDSNELTATDAVFFYGRPVAEVSSSSAMAETAETVTLTATVTDAVVENPELTYQWKQVSGPSVMLNGSGTEVSFEAPTLMDSDAVAFELVVSNGSKSSLPVSTQVMIEAYEAPQAEEPETETPTVETPEEESSNGSGGSTGIALFSLGLLGLFKRRKK